MFMLNQQLLDQLKTEVATELGVTLGANTTSHDNGRVGARMTARLVEMGKMYLEEHQEQQSIPVYNQTYNQNQLHQY
jgi:small acid-soluble spore protein B (major beta-type SASP)